MAEACWATGVFSWSGIRRSRHCRASTPISISAIACPVLDTGFQLTPMLGGVVNLQTFRDARASTGSAAKTKRPSEPRNPIVPKQRKAEAKIGRKNRPESESLYHRRLRLFVLPPRAHILRHRRVAALVPQGPDLSIQHPAILQPFPHPPVDILGEGLPAYRVAGHVQLLGNPPDRTASAFHFVDLFHLSHLQQGVSRTSAECLRMMPPPSDGSIPGCCFRTLLCCY